MISVAPFLNHIVLCWMIAVCIMKRGCSKWDLWNWYINVRKAILVNEFNLLKVFFWELGSISLCHNKYSPGCKSSDSLIRRILIQNLLIILQCLCLKWILATRFPRNALCYTLTIKWEYKVNLTIDQDWFVYNKVRSMDLVFFSFDIWLCLVFQTECSEHI